MFHLVPIIYLFIFFGITSSTGFTQSLKGSDPLPDQVDNLLYQLFPNRTIDQHFTKRQLAIYKAPYVPGTTPPCATCTIATVPTCSILAGKIVEEVYYPQDLSKKETCIVIDTFAKRISNEIFGNGRTFRDTSQCREIVMQYLCLFYGSDNNMYRNYCLYVEDVNPTGPEGVLLTARPPCRSFCVQVANVCANDPTFIHTCNRIACPPTEGKCTADPFIEANLDANIGCDVPYYRTPYNTAAKNGLSKTIYALSLTLISFLVLLFTI